MIRRAAVCIGVDKAGSMTPLNAAVSGAIAFEAWASSQGCDTKLITDRDEAKVTISDIFDAVNEFVDQTVYEQLIIYFSGHGILTAPGTEYWLLSRAPQNPNEAVNLFRSVQDARNSGIPHIIFISDACRSSVQGPPLSGMLGGSIFPNNTFNSNSAEVDIFYATRPGDPAWEVPESEAAQQYKGIFTDCLLKEVNDLGSQCWEVSKDVPPSKVITSRGLKKHLISRVEQAAEAINIRLRQQPELRVETAPPLYFALGSKVTGFIPPEDLNLSTPLLPITNIEKALHAINPARPKDKYRDTTSPNESLSEIAEEISLSQQVQKLLSSSKEEPLGIQTGFIVHGTRGIDVIVDKTKWKYDIYQLIDANQDRFYHVSLVDKAEHNAKNAPSSAVLKFNDKTGTALAILPGFIGIIVIEDDRVVSVNYIPSIRTPRFLSYLRKANELEDMKAFAAVASRNGSFTVDAENAYELVKRIRQMKGIDPTMGLYAAYSYAQIGKHKDVLSVFEFMYSDEYIPLLFDVVMLASQNSAQRLSNHDDRGFAPFMPMLTQGWALLSPDSPMHNPIHERIRPTLIPSLWTTFSREGVEIASNALLTI